MKTSDFDFSLPSELIAQHPPKNREEARLLIVDRETRTLQHKNTSDILSLFGANDVLVFNRSKVVPARILLPNSQEICVAEYPLSDIQNPTLSCLVRPGKKFREDAAVTFSDGSTAKVITVEENGFRKIMFSPKEKTFANFLEQFGTLPLPPYIKRSSEEFDKKRYQTVFGDTPGSIAAPTAGLHLTEAILSQLKEKGVQIEFVTLHVGPGTFLPVKSERIEDHTMHEEYYEIDKNTATALNSAKKSGKVITAIGSTALRTLESAVQNNERIKGLRGKTDLFLYPPSTFSFVDRFFTNFHLPKSTLLMLLSAFASPGKTDGREFVLEVYEKAIQEKYRFFSYGDATLWK